MPMRKQVSPKKRSEIVTLLKEGYAIRKISVKVGVPKSTVSDIRSRWLANPSGHGSPTKKRTGRPRRSSERLDRVIIRRCEQNRFLSSKQIKATLGDFGASMSERTIRRRLQHAGFSSRRPAKKPFVNAFQRRRRVLFAQKYAEKGPEYWQRVIFSDESSFDLHGNRGSLRVRRRIGERYLPKCTMATTKHPVSVMVWGCFSNKGVGRLRIFENGERVNQKVYLDVLQNELLRTRQEHYPEGGAIFQDDNAPCHRAKTIKEWLARNEVEHIQDWPGQSPDVNPIENLWAVVGRVIYERAPKSRSEIISAIIQAWHHVITPASCTQLVDSMQRRLRSVIQAKGFPTRY